MVVSNIFYFHPCLGKWSKLTNIFQMGWNHQLGNLSCFFFFRISPKLQLQLGMKCKPGVAFEKPIPRAGTTYHHSHASCASCIGQVLAEYLQISGPEKWKFPKRPQFLFFSPCFNTPSEVWRLLKKADYPGPHWWPGDVYHCWGAKPTSGRENPPFECIKAL